MSRNTLHMSSNVQRVAIIQIKKNAERGKDRPENERKRKGKSISIKLYSQRHAKNSPSVLRLVDATASEKACN